MVMDTAMEPMAASGLCIQKRLLARYLLVLGVGACSNASALDWRMTPFLSTSEIFSDNLNLAPDNSKSGFVTELAPGFNLYGNSVWGNFDMNYRLQGLYNAGGRDAIDVNHQLQMNSQYQLLRDRVFVDTSSSITQQNTSGAQIGTDNISGNGNRADTQSFSISPYWTPKFGQWANGLFRVGYSRISFDNASSDRDGPSVSRFISDSNTYSWQGGLSSGAKFDVVKWNLNYSHQEQQRANGNDVRFANYTADARYFINRTFNLLVLGGYDDNQFGDTNNNFKNGFSYEVGGQWKPSMWYSIEAAVGNNQHITVQANPSKQLSANVTFRNKEVGLNRGTSWDGALNYQSMQGSVQFHYFQETTTVQQLYTRQGVYMQDPNGSLIQLNDASGNIANTDLLQQGFILFNPTGFVDDVIVRKRADLGFNYQLGKSTYNATIYNERRSYSLTASQDDVYGATANWNWQFAQRFSFYLRPLWQTTQGSFDSTRYDVALGLTRSFPINLGRPSLLNTGIELRHIDQSSDNALGDYKENRATANFAVRF